MNNEKFKIDSYKRPKLDLPKKDTNKVLLHSCCAPCAGEIMEAISASGIEQTILFYNPNIHPIEEYEIRKNENKRYADKLGIECIDLDYDMKNWFSRVKGLEKEPERGKRCTVCFDMRFEVTALYAKEHGFEVFSSSLGISRWKDLKQINGCGERAASKYEGMEYWSINWRKKGGSARMLELSKKENFYQQEYCGCSYSLRDSNEWRVKNNRPKIKIKTNFYGIDKKEESSENPLIDLKQIN
jgi:predicted adenine nucleotide alpha hydrolase (AANH) superfamily ATPase